jgi:hypothetical protein
MEHQIDDGGYSSGDTTPNPRIKKSELRKKKIKELKRFNFSYFIFNLKKKLKWT